MDAVKLYAQSLTAENFTATYREGTLANLIRGNPRILNAWQLGQDAAPRVAPRITDILVDAVPAIVAIPADPANNILGVIGAAAIPAITAYETDPVTLAPTANGLNAWRKDLKTFEKDLENDVLAAGNTMKLFLDAYHPDQTQLRRLQLFCKLKSGLFVNPPHP